MEMSQQPEVLNQVSNGAAVQLHTAPIATKRTPYAEIFLRELCRELCLGAHIVLMHRCMRCYISRLFLPKVKLKRAALSFILENHPRLISSLQIVA
jgi:hypothetical protein